MTFKGNQKDVNNIKSCLKLLNSFGEDMSLFVSHFLDELLLVTFNRMNVSSLLCNMRRLHSEICALRQAVKVQAEVSEDLHIITSTTDYRVGVVERLVVANGGEQLGMDMSVCSKDLRYSCRHSHCGRG